MTGELWRALHPGLELRGHRGHLRQKLRPRCAVTTGHVTRGVILRAEMIAAAGSNNAFAINGFTGFSNTQIVSFFFMFLLFNGYVVLEAASLAAFYVTSKPRHGRVRTAAIWHFMASVLFMLAFVSTVWGAPAEKSFIGTTAPPAELGVGTRTIALFIGMGIFAAPGVLCMLIGFILGARQKREIREEALAVA